MEQLELELDAPPPYPIQWLAVNEARELSCYVEAQTWVVARAKAAAQLGCEPGQLTVTPVLDK